MRNGFIRWGSHRRSDSTAPRLLSVALLLLVSVLLILPLYAILKEAFTTGDAVGLENLREVAGSFEIKRSIANTLFIGLVSGVGATVLGAVMAVTAILVPSGKWMGMFLRIVPLVPLTVPALVGAIGWTYLLSPRVGWLNIFIRDTLGLDSETGPLQSSSLLVIAGITCLYVIPFVYTVFASALQRLSTEPLEAMMVSGASVTSTVVRTLFGSLRPATLSAFSLSVVQSMSLFSVAIVMGADVLPTYVYRNATSLGRPELAAIAALPLMIVAFGLTIVQTTMLRKAARFVTVTGKGALGRPLKFRRPASFFLKGFSVFYVFASGVLPLGAIAVASMLPYWKPRFSLGDLSTDQYGLVLENALVRDALGNSVKLALLCAFAAVTLTFLLIVFAERLKIRPARWGLFVANIPLGIPAAVLGLGFLLAFIEGPVVLYGTIWLLFFAYLVAYLPISLRNISPVIQQVSGELDEAARVHGAGKSVTIARITLPLAAPGLAASFLLLFILMFREFPVASFVATPGTSVISVVLLNFQETGRFPAVSVLAMLILLVSFAGILLSTFVERLVKLRRS